jgi:hypothetical protein
LQSSIAFGAEQPVFSRQSGRNFDQAITGYSAALLLDPGHATSLYGRGIAKQKKGDNAGGNADIEAAKKIKLKIADEFSGYGVE